MHSVSVRDPLLTAYDVSSILKSNLFNVVVDLTGGPFKEFKCQGLCREHRRREWERIDLNK